MELAPGFTRLAEAVAVATQKNSLMFPQFLPQRSQSVLPEAQADQWAIPVVLVAHLLGQTEQILSLEAAALVVHLM
jgi:hypothetical protein